MEFREDLGIHKTRMNGLSCGEEIMAIRSAVLIQYQRVTDRRTDVKPISITCFSIADASKNVKTRFLNFEKNVKYVFSNNAYKYMLRFNQLTVPTACVPFTLYSDMRLKRERAEA